jgi:hypothetical protein
MVIAKQGVPDGAAYCSDPQNMLREKQTQNKVNSVHPERGT